MTPEKLAYKLAKDINNKSDQYMKDVKFILAYADKIRRECNDEVYRKMLSVELTKDHDRQIRNECACSAVNDWFLNAQIDHNEETLRAAIMGKEAQ